LINLCGGGLYTFENHWASRTTFTLPLRIDATPDLRAKTQGGRGAALANVYADAGVWYDALAALSEAIDAHPKDAALHQTRADLLQQVGLKGLGQ
jgi:hypothetical protein